MNKLEEDLFKASKDGDNDLFDETLNIFIEDELEFPSEIFYCCAFYGRTSMLRCLIDSSEEISSSKSDLIAGILYYAIIGNKKDILIFFLEHLKKQNTIIPDTLLMNAILTKNNELSKLLINSNMIIDEDMMFFAKIFSKDNEIIDLVLKKYNKKFNTTKFFT